MTTEPTCAMVIGGLTDHLEEASPPRIRRTYDQHLLHCTRCSTGLRQLDRTLHLLRSLPPERIPTPRKHVLLEAFRGRQNAS